MLQCNHNLNRKKDLIYTHNCRPPKHLLHKGDQSQPSCTITLREAPIIVTDPFCYPDRRRKVGMHLHVFVCTGWPHASAPHFSYCQMLHIFDLQYSIIGHQLNYYWGVIILNLSVQNCRNKKEWLIVPTFACGSTTLVFTDAHLDHNKVFYVLLYALCLRMETGRSTAVYSFYYFIYYNSGLEPHTGLWWRHEPTFTACAFKTLFTACLAQLLT